MRIGLLVLIGIPGSGKTTLAKNLANFSETTYNFIHICYDELIPFPIGNFDSEWKSTRNSVLVKIERLIQGIKNKNAEFFPPELSGILNSVNSWESDFVLIIDDNMYFRSMRYSIFQIAKKHSVSFCQMYLNCSVENALLNNCSRPPESAVPSDIITNMSAKIEPPNCKNNWEKYSMSINGNFNLKDIYYEIYPLLESSLNNPFYEKYDNNENKELSKVQCRKSMLHQSDIAIRKIISCKMKNYFCENPKEKSKNLINELNLRKSELLSDIKAGNICLPDEVLEEINSDVLEKFQLLNFLGSYF